MPSYPAKNWRDAWNAFNPTTALDATDPRYVDLTLGRGEAGAMSPRALQRIQRADPEEPMVQLVAGHFGCGKTTELRQLQHNLENAGFVVGNLALDQDLDLQDAETIDILLAIARQVFALAGQRGLKLDGGLLGRIESWFAQTEILKETSHQVGLEVSVGGSVGGKLLSLASMLGEMTGRLRTGTESKRLIRQQLEPQVSQLHHQVKDLIREVRSEIRKAHRDLVLIADTLDRIPYVLRADNRSNQEAIFIERGELLRDLGCHLILTVPISLLFSERVKHLETIFPDRFVVPMIKLRDRAGGKFEAGWELLRQMIHRRLDPSLSSREVEDLLIEHSGGHPRQLIALMRSALDHVADQDRALPIAAAHKAIHFHRNGFDRAIQEADWSNLARVHRSKSLQNDDAHRALLFNLSVLEYQNEERWCDVNPLILGLQRFKAASGSSENANTHAAGAPRKTPRR